MVNWSTVGWIWAAGWPVTCLLYGPLLTVLSQTNELRAETADMRSMWLDQRGRAILCLSFFLTWPLVFAVELFIFPLHGLSLVVTRLDNRNKEKKS
jgi:hypothetical protein